MLPEHVADAFLLDVRELQEWTVGHVPTAVHVPMADVPGRVDLLPERGVIAVICRIGARSAQVAAWLRSQGWDAHNVDGGMMAWQAAGLPMDGQVW